MRISGTKLRKRTQRVAVGASGLALSMGGIVGLAGPAQAAPTAPETSSATASAKSCGFSKLHQQYYNCSGHPQEVDFMYFDSIGRTWGNAFVCVPTGRTSVFKAIGPYRAAWTAESTGKCSDPI